MTGDVIEGTWPDARNFRPVRASLGASGYQSGTADDRTGQTDEPRVRGATTRRGVPLPGRGHLDRSRLTTRATPSSSRSSSPSATRRRVEPRARVRRRPARAADDRGRHRRSRQHGDEAAARLTAHPLRHPPAPRAPPRRRGRRPRHRRRHAPSMAVASQSALPGDAALPAQAGHRERPDRRPGRRGRQGHARCSTTPPAGSTRSTELSRESDRRRRRDRRDPARPSPTRPARPPTCCSPTTPRPATKPRSSELRDFTADSMDDAHRPRGGSCPTDARAALIQAAQIARPRSTPQAAAGLPDLRRRRDHRDPAVHPRRRSTTCSTARPAATAPARRGRRRRPRPTKQPRDDRSAAGRPRRDDAASLGTGRLRPAGDASTDDDGGDRQRRRRLDRRTVDRASPAARPRTARTSDGHRRRARPIARRRTCSAACSA